MQKEAKMPKAAEIDIFDEKSLNISPQAARKLDEYERVIPILDDSYAKGHQCIHPDTGEVVSDTEYEKMRNFVRQIKPDSKALQGQIGQKVTAGKICVHNPPMTSIDKANGTLDERIAVLKKWCNKSIGTDDDEQLKHRKLVASYKRDGVALAIYYKEGKLVQAGLRPRDGINGLDVTENVKHVKGVPQQLPVAITCSIRGELECKKSVFEKLNGSPALDNQEFANPRNYTSGSIQQDDPAKVAKRELSFTAYTIEGLDNAPYKTARERAIWCNKELKVPFVRVEPYDFDTLQEMESTAADLDYEVDGIIVEVDDLEAQEQLGRSGDTSTGNPRGKIAWKFDDETADVEIQSVTWATGRTGRISPVALFKPTSLAGTMVSRCSLYSLGFMMRNNIHHCENSGKGKRIRIRKSGKIIPETLGVYDDSGKFIEKIEAGDPVLKDDFDTIIKSISYPKNCPSCGETTTIVKGQKVGMFDLSCANTTSCPAQNIKRFINYLQVTGVKGVGEEAMKPLVEEGKVKGLAELYEVTVTDLINLGLSKRESLLVVANIHLVPEPEKERDNRLLGIMTVQAIKSPKRMPLSKFIAGLGIPGAGKGTGGNLATHFLDIHPLLDANEEEIAKVEGIGGKTAKAIADFFQMHKSDIKKLLNYVSLDLPTTGRFTGKTFVFTGALPEGKDYWKDIVEAEGGIVKSSVSKKINYVIIGDAPGSKADKAHELKAEGHDLEILDYNSFKILMN